MPEITTLEEAKRQSRHCTHCHGEGRATIFRRGYQGSATREWIDPETGESKTILMRTTAYCECLAGQWVRSMTYEQQPDLARRCPDLHDIVRNPDSAWSPDDPTIADLERSPTWSELKAQMARKPMVQTRPGPAKREPIRKTPRLPEPREATQQPQERDDSEIPF